MRDTPHETNPPWTQAHLLSTSLAVPLKGGAMCERMAASTTTASEAPGHGSSVSVPRAKGAPAPGPSVGPSSAKVALARDVTGCRR